MKPSTIWKFPLTEIGETSVMMPKFAEILCVQMQAGAPCLWAVVDPEQPIQKRSLRIYGTGHPIIHEKYALPDRYIGTIQTRDGLVFHVFEVGAGELA